MLYNSYCVKRRAYSYVPAKSSQPGMDTIPPFEDMRIGGTLLGSDIFLLDVGWPPEFHLRRRESILSIDG